MAFNDTLFQLGMDLTRSSPAQKEEHGEVAHVMAQHTKKNERESGRFAGTTPKTMGTHVTIDVYGITGLDTIEHVETTLSRVVSAACVSVASSTLQHLHLHPVPATGGISGVAVLSDGHISFHSRPGAGMPYSTFPAARVKCTVGLPQQRLLSVIARSSPAFTRVSR